MPSINYQVLYICKTPLKATCFSKILSTFYMLGSSFTTASGKVIRSMVWPFKMGVGEKAGPEHKQTVFLYCHLFSRLSSSIKSFYFARDQAQNSENLFLRFHKPCKFKQGICIKPVFGLLIRVNLTPKLGTGRVV